MAEHAEPVRTAQPARDATHGKEASLSSPELQTIAHRLNGAPRVASLKRDAEQLNGGLRVRTLQRAARSSISATFTPPDAVVENPQPAGIATTATVQRAMYIHQVQEFRAGINDLHYRYDDDIDGSAQAGEHLHVTVTYQPPAPPPPPAVAGAAPVAPAAPPPAQTHHCYYNYNDDSWRWDDAPAANVTGVVNLYKDFAIQWAAQYRPADDDEDDGEQQVPEGGFVLDDDDDFPLPGH